jgi:sulfate transport system ATP-binding protein
MGLMGIAAHRICKRFGDFVALDDVDLDVEPGRLTALLGPSGGGKSTLLRIIGGLEEPDAGTVHIDGVEATGVPAQRRNVGFVFQHYAAFKHLSVFRNVAFGLEIRKRPKAEIRSRVHELLELVHLEQFAERLPSQLSGGQRQRMALARALAVEPKVLLLDEPFGALDAQVRKELRDWLRRLHDEVHVTTVFVTHDQEEALEVADEIVVINHGRIEQAGSPNDLYDHPANDFVMGFLGPVTQLAGHLVRPHDIEVLTAPGPGAVQAQVARLVRIGFEVRAELRAGAEEPWVQLTRGQADALGLRPQATVWLRPAHDASVLAARPPADAHLLRPAAGDLPLGV